MTNKSITLNQHFFADNDIKYIKHDKKIQSRYYAKEILIVICDYLAIYPNTNFGVDFNVIITNDIYDGYLLDDDRFAFYHTCSFNGSTVYNMQISFRDENGNNINEDMEPYILSARLYIYDRVYQVDDDIELRDNSFKLFPDINFDNMCTGNLFVMLYFKKDVLYDFDKIRYDFTCNMIQYSKSLFASLDSQDVDEINMKHMNVQECIDDKGKKYTKRNFPIKNIDDNDNNDQFESYIYIYTKEDGCIDKYIADNALYQCKYIMIEDADGEELYYGTVDAKKIRSVAKNRDKLICFLYS